MLNHEDYLKTSDVAKALGVSSDTIRRWVRTGKLVPMMTTIGGHALFTKEQVDALRYSAVQRAKDPKATNTAYGK